MTTPKPTLPYCWLWETSKPGASDPNATCTAVGHSRTLLGRSILLSFAHTINEQAKGGHPTGSALCQRFVKSTIAYDIPYIERPRICTARKVSSLPVHFRKPNPKPCTSRYLPTNWSKFLPTGKHEPEGRRARQAHPFLVDIFGRRPPWAHVLYMKVTFSGDVRHVGPEIKNWRDMVKSVPYLARPNALRALVIQKMLDACPACSLLPCTARYQFQRETILLSRKARVQSPLE